MEFSIGWMSQYVDLPAGGVDEVAELLTASGMAVEGRRQVGEDTVIDVDVTTNRPDCMNHLGLARELAVLTGRPLRPPSSEVQTDDAEPATSVAALVVEAPALCPRYDVLVLRDVEIGPSPAWLAQRLEAIGSRSINNVVDITNYVMWETGQPLHAFDMAKIAQNAAGLHELRVRRAHGQETVVTLDDVERTLDAEILVNADPRQVVGLAGIMGGASSEVSAETRDILLESAHFDPTTVRKSAARLGMHTDASHRFERGADPEACLWAARRAAALIAEVAGGRVLSGHLEAKALRSDWPPRVELDLGRLNAFGGTEIDAATSERILTGLGFALERHGSERPNESQIPSALQGEPVHYVVTGDAIRWRVTVPSWRWYDFERVHAQDIYEEVLRAYGFDNIPATLPSLGAPDGRTGAPHKLRRKVQDVLAAAGLTEVINFAFHDQAGDDAFPSLYGDRPAMRLANPLSDRYSTMRRSLLPNLVDSARFNLRRNAPAVRLFEIGHVFVAGTSESEGDEHDASDWGHDEMDVVALVLGGALGTPWEHRIDLDFYDLKGIIEALAFELGAALTWRGAERPRLSVGATAEILLTTDDGGEERIGHLGRLEEADLAYPLYVAELALEPLGRAGRDLVVRAPSRHPGVTVDTTLTHSRQVPWRDLAAAIEARPTRDLVRFDLHDRYTGQGVPAGAVNTTLRFHYIAEDRSLTQEEVNQRHTTLTDHLEELFGL